MAIMVVWICDDCGLVVNERLIFDECPRCDGEVCRKLVDDELRLVVGDPPADSDL